MALSNQFVSFFILIFSLWYLALFFLGYVHYVYLRCELMVPNQIRICIFVWILSSYSQDTGVSGHYSSAPYDQSRSHDVFNNISSSYLSEDSVPDANSEKELVCIFDFVCSKYYQKS